jgi:hypothetical protein
MNTPRVLCLAAATAVAVSAVHAVSKADLARNTPVTSDEPIPTIDFIREPLLRSPELNRAGTHVAAMISAGDDHVQLLVQNLATQKFEYIIAPDEMDVTSFTWLDDSRILFNCGGQRLFVAEINDLKHAYRVLEYCSPYVVAVPEENRLRPLVWVRSDPFFNGRSTGVITLKADFSDTRPVTAAGGTTMPGALTYHELNQEHVAFQFPVPQGGLEAGYFGDKEGALAFGYTSKDGVLTLHAFADGAWKPCPFDVEEQRVVGPGNKPGELVVVARHPQGTPSTLQFMDAATGKLGDVLLEDPEYDFNGRLFRDPATHNVVGAVYDRATPQVAWFSEAYQRVQKVIDAFFPGLVVRIIDGDRAGGKFLLGTYSDRQPVTYYLLDVEKNAVGLIKNSRPWLDAKRMRPTNLMKYKTRDGHKLDAYVTLPNGASKEHPVGLVVLAPSALWDRANPTFDMTAQIFAAHGYAVLRPNYRWAAGNAWMFPRDDEWALDKMAQDINEATKALLRSGLIDRQRIAIFGARLGGNLALTAVVGEPDLYHSAITIQGIFDFTQYIKEAKYFEHLDDSYGTMVRKLGDPKRDKEKLNAMSPARHVDRIHIPVFVAENREASATSVAQSRGLLSQLGAHDVPHEVLWQTGVGYATQRLDDGIELYDHILAFLGRNMPAPAHGTASMP